MLSKSRTGALTCNFGIDSTGKYYSGNINEYPYVENMSCWPGASERLLELFKSKPRNASLTAAFRSESLERISWTDKGKDRFNDCFHHKTACAFAHQIGWAKYDGLPSWRWYSPSYRRVPYYFVPLKEATVMEPSDFVKARAWAFMQPRFESSFQLLNSLFELKDFREIGSNIYDTLNAVRQWRTPRLIDQFVELGRLNANKPAQKRQRERQLIYRLGATPGKAIDSALDTVATFTLFKQLCIDPLLKDLVALSLAARISAEQALAEFKLAGEEADTRHYSETLRDESFRHSIGDNGMYPFASLWIIDKSVYTATMQYKYRYHDIGDLEVALRYWGATGSAEALWNMLPFTFLVDYVFGVADALYASSFDTNLELTTLQYCESVKSQYTIASAVDPSGMYGVKPPYSRVCAYHLEGKPLDLTNGRVYPFSGYTNTVYSRQVGVPYKGIVVPKFKWPSTRQWSNVAALVKVILF